MTKTKKILMISVGFLAAGAILTGIGMAMGGSPANIQIGHSGLQIRPSYISSGEKESLQKLEKTPIDHVTAVDFDIIHADLIVVPSDGFYLEYQLSGNREEPVWEVLDGGLSFRSGDYWGSARNQVNVQLFSFNQKQDNIFQYVKLYVPRETLFSAWKLNMAHGDVEITGLNAEDGTMALRYSDIVLKESGFSNLALEGSHGDARFDQVEIDQLDMDMQYADIYADRSSIAKMRLEDGRHGSMTAIDIQNEHFVCISEYMEFDFRRFHTTDVTIEGEHGYLNLDLQGCKTLHIDSSYTEMQIRMDQKLRDYSTSIRLEYGDVTINGMGHDNTYVSEDDGDGAIDIKGRHGDVELVTKK